MKTSYDELAREYAAHRRVQPEVLKNLLAYSGLERSSRTLEVGCGTGNYVIALQEATSCACWGNDPSEQMLAAARQRTSQVVFQLGGAETLDFADGFFDLLFSVDVIHHVVDRGQYFQGAFRVLRAGGRICTVTDSAEIIRQRQPLSTYFPESVAIELKRYPRIAELRRLMETAGFTNLEERLVVFPYTLTDLQIFRDKAFSCLHLIPEEAYQRGLRRMEADLGNEPIQAVSRYVALWGSK